MPVPVAPLADVLAALGVDRVDLLVLDCEGCEHAVLAETDGGWFRGWVERFDRRGTEPFELFRSEFGQNSWNRKKTTKSYFIEVSKFRYFR